MPSVTLRYAAGLVKLMVGERALTVKRFDQNIALHITVFAAEVLTFS